MTTLMGKDDCIPMFFPNPLRELVLEYLASIWEVELLFAKEVHGPAKAATYHE